MGTWSCLTAFHGINLTEYDIEKKLIDDDIDIESIGEEVVAVAPNDYGPTYYFIGVELDNIGDSTTLAKIQESFDLNKSSILEQYNDKFEEFLNSDEFTDSFKEFIKTIKPEIHIVATCF